MFKSSESEFSTSHSHVTGPGSDPGARVGLGCRFKANCPLVGHEPIGGAPSEGFFLRDSSPYLL